MTDGEKKEKVSAGFNPRNSEWQTCKTFWHQSSDLAFDNILARGATAAKFRCNCSRRTGIWSSIVSGDCGACGDCGDRNN